MDKKRLSLGANVLIWIVVIIGLYGTVGLVQAEWVQGDICPEIAGIPACYIIFTCLLLALFSHLQILKDRFVLYFIGVGLALTIASVGTVGQVMGYLECPKTDGGTPMCFLSFGIFSNLLVLKGWEVYLMKEK